MTNDKSLAARKSKDVILEVNEPLNKKAKFIESEDEEHFGDASSLSSLSEESISSSDWEVWNESDWLSETSDDDPDW